MSFINQYPKAEIITHMEQTQKINVDEIVNNNTKKENENIINEFKQVKKSVESIMELKKKFVKSNCLTIKEFDNMIKNTYTVLVEKYEAIYKWCIEKDDVDTIYRMIDSQIGVAEQKLSFNEQSNNFGNELHEKYVKPKLENNKH